MPSLISHLSRSRQCELLDDLNYLNIQEFRSFCHAHSIPYKILIETESGKRKQSRDTDRKSIVLERIRHYLKTGKVPDPTCFSARIVRLDGMPAKLKPTDRLYYGWYDKKHRGMLELLRNLTNGQFRSGAIARILCREFWTAGKAPTFAQYAKAWLKENEKGLGFHPEAAWLTDRARGEAGKDWRAKRQRKATKVLKTLSTL